MTLINDNCLEAFLDMPDASIDLTVTSPPYDSLRTYNGNNNQWSESVWKSIIVGLYNKTKNGGVVVWIVGDQTQSGSETGTSFKQALWAIECGFRLHDTMIWRKSNFSNPSSNRYHQTFEYMFIFSKGKPKTFNPIKDRKNIYAGQSTRGQNSVRQADGSLKIAGKRTINEFGMRHNVWDVNTSGQNMERFDHPAPFSLAIAEGHILSWSNPGDTIMDCFMGSGTTGVACKKLGREFIGIEMDEAYFKVAENRINEAGELPE